MVEQPKKYHNVFAFTPKDIELYVHILARGFHTKKLTFNEFKEEMKDVMLVDRDSTLWTIGAGSGAWYRREEDNWIRSIPSEELFSVHNIIKDMTRTTRECPSCHNRVPQDYRFCPHCGVSSSREKPVAKTGQPPDQKAAHKPVYCRKCGSLIQPASRFCIFCGTQRRR